MGRLTSPFTSGNKMSRLLIEQSYVMQMMIHLPKFKWIPQSRVATFRCIICGDSQKNQSKTRGYIFINQKNKTFFSYKCHNCGYNDSFLFFLKEYLPSVYAQIKLEMMKEYSANKRTESVPEPIEPKKEEVFSSANTLKRNISRLPEEHIAKQYCADRMIPKDKLQNIFYVRNFKLYIDSICPGKYFKIPEDERIVFEFRDENNNLTGVQGRILGSSKGFRFLTLKFVEDSYKIFGIEHINKQQPIFVTEGVFDSFFLDNSIAQTGGDVIPNLDEVLGVPKQQIYIVLDNEPRSIDTVHRMENAIKHGYMINFWNIDTNLKDINDMIKSGLTKEYIQNSILNNSLSGFKAKAKFHTWKKI